MSATSEDQNYNNVNWDEVIKKEAIGIDGLDLGEVQEVGDTFIVTQVGLINKKKYHLPKSSVESFDGELLKFKINESDLNSFEQTEDQRFNDYSSFKSSDMSKELETVIPLVGEKLDVTKRIVEDNVTITKEPVKETKSVEIELMHEKITIEKKMINKEEENKHTKSADFTKDQPLIHKSPTNETPNEKEILESKVEFTIPIKREEPVITKTPYVREEVVVKKMPVRETKTITEEITHEEIDYDNSKISDVRGDDTSSA